MNLKSRAGLIALLALTTGAAHATPTFYNLGVLGAGGTYSRGTQVSADGWVVAGLADLHGDEFWGDRAFRWTLSGGMQALGVPSGCPWSAGNSISADGSTIAGNAGNHPYRQSISSGPQNLGQFAGGNSGLAFGLSGDGSITVGYANDGSFTDRAFRWTSAGGMQSLGTLPGGGSGGSGAYGISSDGSTIVGTSAGSWANSHAFRWTSAGGMQDLGVLFGGDHSHAYSASADGSAVAGFSNWVGDESSGYRAFRWTSAGGMQNLGVPPGAIHSYANVISGNGLVVAGQANYGVQNPSRPALWSPPLGMVDLTAYLSAHGVNMTGWVLTDARGLSADGSALSGTGLYNGLERAFLVRGLFGSATCYANCDGSTAAPALNVLDFACFINRFTAGDPVANCDASTTPPVLNVLDFEHGRRRGSDAVRHQIGRAHV